MRIVMNQELSLHLISFQGDFPHFVQQVLFISYSVALAPIVVIHSIKRLSSSDNSKKAS